RRHALRHVAPDEAADGCRPGREHGPPTECGRFCLHHPPPDVGPDRVAFNEASASRPTQERVAERPRWAVGSGTSAARVTARQAGLLWRLEEERGRLAIHA